MNTPDNFDELSRRKLAEREFPFEEAHWIDVQRALESGRKRKAAWWPWAAGALLLIGVGAWWAVNTTDDKVYTAQLPASETTSTTTTTSVEQTTSTAPAELADGPIPTTSVVQGIASAEEVSAKTQGASSDVERNLPLKASSSHPGGERDMSEVRTAEREHPSPPAPASTTPGTHVTMSAVPGSIPIAAAGEITVAATTGSMASTDTLAGTTSIAEHDAKAENDEKAASHRQVEEPISVGQTTVVAKEATTLTNGKEPAPAQAVEASVPTTADSSLASTEPITLPQPTSTVRWEISALGGALSTGSAYAGGNTVEWTNALSNGTTATFGAEIMRMGRNTGIGAGIQYTTYADRFNEADRFRTDIDYRNYYFLTTVDTTVTIVVGIDTVGGDTSYITQQVTTSVAVLDSGVDTVSNTTLTSEARNHVNMVSYVEIPLFFDAHLTQGRWNLGVRGGPFLGVLTGRRGALPNAAWDGYMDLSDQQFRSLVFGYTARVYVRYRFNAAWSLGLEPCIRGQLIDAHGSGEVTRRSTGVGALLSLSYVLR